MIICEFCLQYTKNGECSFGLRIPKRMGCREFDPGIGKFCSDPNDFVSPGQIIQMATFFGLKGTELKKVKAIALWFAATHNVARAISLLPQSAFT